MKVTLMSNIDKRITKLKESVRVQALDMALRTELEEEYGLQSHPTRDLVWNKAWEHGHSNGYSEVRYWYSEFVEVL